MKLTEYDISHPYEATVVKSDRITDESTDEVRHIVLNVADATFHHFEGQSIGVLVPGPHEFGNKYHMRLYSIASSRSGEDSNMAEFSICVRRCFYIDEVSGERFPGVASNFLCDRASGDKVLLAGPYGRQFLPPRDNTSNILMIGVGTGIAPFRAFVEERQALGATGKSWLFFGDWTFQDDFLYQLEWQKALKSGALTRMDVAFSRDQAHKVYVQDRMREQAAELFAWLADGAHFYVCGDAKRMAKDVHQALIDIVAEHGGHSPEAAEAYVKQLQKDKRYQRDVY